VIVVDAVVRGEEPGTLFQLEVDTCDLSWAESGGAVVETHDVGPSKVFALAKRLGAPDRRIHVVGCEPRPESARAVELDLGPQVAAAVPEAARMVAALAKRLLGDS
jgi:hydrogenase maturation protease